MEPLARACGTQQGENEGEEHMYVFALRRHKKNYLKVEGGKNV